MPFQSNCCSMKAPTARSLAQAIKCHSLASEYLHGYFSSFTRAPIKKIEIANIAPLLRAYRHCWMIHVICFLSTFVSLWLIFILQLKLQIISAMLQCLTSLSVDLYMWVWITKIRPLGSPSRSHNTVRNRRKFAPLYGKVRWYRWQPVLNAASNKNNWFAMRLCRESYLAIARELLYNVPKMYWTPVLTSTAFQ